MMKSVLASAVLLITLSTQAQKEPVKAPVVSDDPVLMTVDGKPVTRSEFEAIYKKNNKDAAVTKEALNEYLDLFINYKLKVRAAEELGMDTVGKFKTELDGYRKQLARPYLIDRNLNDDLIKEAFDRSGIEVRASHILAQMPADPAPADTLAAWKKIMALRDRVNAGEDWASVASGKGGSDDPSAAKNGGDLGWFSALQMVYPFENAAYSTQPGQISKPVRTRFGYHIIKVIDRRPARGQMKVAHIMIRSTDQDSPEKQTLAKQKIEQVNDRLKSGEINFSDGALKYSDDESTNTKGGELPMFGSGKMIEEFEDVSFGLKQDGDVSGPFKTRYGWHIVKRLEYKAPPAFEEAKGDLKQKIARDSRAEITRQKFLSDLKTTYHAKTDEKALKALYPLVDSTIFKKGTTITDTLIRKDVVEGIVMHNGMKFRRELNGTLQGGKVVNVRSRKHDELKPSPNDTVIVRDVQEGWSYDRTKATKLTKNVFSIDGRAWSQQQFLGWLEAKQKREPMVSTPVYLQDRFKQFVDEEMLAHEDGQLETKYPEFRMLMKEYRDGILLFELTDQKVWSKAVKDTTGLQGYYEANKMNYLYDTRYDLDIYSCANDAVVKQMNALYKKGKRGMDIAKALNKDDKSALIDVESGVFTEEEKPMIKGVVKPGLTAGQVVDGRVVLVDMKKIVPPSPKPLNEARGLVTAAYQDQLEKDWIKELRAKYTVKVEQDVLYSIH
ncbi:MAG: peptidylprolyl isomerase [Flavobacteriales bacterium]|nr:peptidylprolyl isomerase [Flavobacteriales bacterium]